MSAIERVENPISMAELERRWSAVRKEMASRGLDALVMQNSSDWLGGYVKWFTDVPAHNDYPRNVIFHRDDLMTVVEMGNKGGRSALGGKDPLNPGVGDWIFSPSFFSANYTHEYDGALVAQELTRRGTKTIGWVGRGRLQYDLVRVVEAQVTGARFVDATDVVDAIKAIKSPEEIALIRRAAAMQDAQWAKIVAAVKPGMRDSEVTALAQYEGELLGSEQGLFRCSSAPLGEPAILRGRHYQGRTMKPGDTMTLLIENNGPGGHYCELARTFVLGKASPELRDHFATVCEAQKHTVKNLKPGAAPADIYASHNDFMTRHGAPPELGSCDRTYAGQQAEKG
jgi:Xaa-Pro aminopeptidase